MGYRAPTVLIYGVKFTPELAEDFLKELEKELVSQGSSPLNMTDQYTVMQACKKYLNLDPFVLSAENADWSIQSCDWYNCGPSPGNYALGFDVNEYGTLKNIIELSQAPVDIQKQNQWDTILSPMLKKIGINDEAKMQTISQVH